MAVPDAVLLPGVAFAYAMNSGTVLAGNQGFTTMTFVERMMAAIGAMSWMKLNWRSA